MLGRVANLPADLRGSTADRKGVLAKAPKPIQDLRVDMPVIGPRTVEMAAAAGLAGIAGVMGAAGAAASSAFMVFTLHLRG